MEITAGVVAVLIQILIAVGTLIKILPELRRVDARNKRDELDATKIALEIAGMDANEQLELKQEIAHLKNLMERKRYKITVTFRLGDRPFIEETSIESYDAAQI